MNFDIGIMNNDIGINEYNYRCTPSRIVMNSCWCVLRDTGQEPQ